MQSTASEIEAVMGVGASHKNLDIEVLRAFAVVLTMLSHSGYLLIWGSPVIGWLGGHVGLWAGVDLFFCISGFVITRGLYRQLTTAADSEGRARVVFSFWIRRLHRIMPSALLWLCIGIALTAMFNRSGAFGDLRTNTIDAIASVVQMQDVHLYQCFGSGPNTCGTVPVFGPYWSLSLEEKFYLILPVVMIISGARFRLLAAIAIAVQIVLPRMTHDLLWFFRTDAFLLGALIALARGGIAHRIFEPRFIKRNMLARLVPIGMLMLIVGVVSPYQVVPIYTGMLALTCAVVVWFASYGEGYILGSGHVRRALAWVGSRSFAMYLIHMPVFCLTHEIWSRIEGNGATFGGNYTIRFLATALLMLVIAAEINFRFVETPLRKKGAEISRRILQPTSPA